MGTSACVHEREGTAAHARRLSHSCENIGIALKSCEGGQTYLKAYGCSTNLAEQATVTSRPACEGALASREGSGDHAGCSICHPVNEKDLTCFCPGWRISSPTLSLVIRLAFPTRFSHDSNICHMNAADGVGSMQYLLLHMSYCMTSWRWECMMAACPTIP